MKNFKHLLLILVSITSLSSYAQTSKKTLNYQAVILDPNAIDIPGASISGQPLNKGNVCLRFSLLNATGGLDYEETQQVTTDEYGLVSVAIGTGTQGTSPSTYKTFNSIVWNANVKSLKVSVSYDGCSSFKQVSTQVFNYTPYALYAEAVDYANVKDAPTKLSQFSNDAGYLIPKDLDPIKADIKSNTSQIQTANQSIADNKLANDAAFLVVNQSLSGLDKQIASNTSSITSLNSRINDQQNQIFDNRNQLGGLQGQLNVTNSTVNNLTGVAEVVSNKSTSTILGGANTSDQLYPTQKATKTYVDQAVAQVANGTISDATTLAAGKIQLAGDLGGTATSPTVPALAGKENSSNKSNASLGNSTTLFPTQNAVKSYVDSQIASATIVDADGTTKGKLQLAGDLGGTAAAPTVPGLLLKEDVSRKSTATDLGAGSTSDINYPSQKAVKTYVDSQIASATIADANRNTKGKLQLAGDLTGTAAAPLIAADAINSSKIQDRSIATDDIADGAITDGKISGVSGVKVSGNIAGNSSNVTGIIAVSNGGTGTPSLTGYVKGNGTSAMTSVSSIPVSDVTGAIKKVNGTLPNSSGEVTILFGSVSTGTLANRPINPGLNGDIYIISADTNPSNDGRTYISDGSVWNEVTANAATTDARYLQLAGGIMDGNVSFPSGKKVLLADAPSGSTDAANKAYVDSKISSDAPNATSSAPGKIQLIGDLGGTATSPTVPGLALKAPINNPAFTGTVTGVTKAMVGLSNVDNTSDASKPVSTATQTALDLKAPLASPTFTGTVSGITKAMVDLANVDNTSDVNKPVSTAAQTALNLKENVSNKSNAALGTSTTLYPTQNAVKTYVDAQVASGAPDADATTKGKIQLAGDLTGTAASPSIASGAVTSAKILDATILTADLADASVTDAKIVGLAGSKVSGNITGNAANVTGTVAIANGGTGATSAGAALTALGAAPLASPTFTGTVTSPIYASAPQSLTDAATISWNPANGLNASVTLGGNRTLSFSSTPAAGSYGTLVITQDATGGRTITLPSTSNKVLGSSSTTTIALSAAANAKDILNFYYDGTNCYWNVGQGFGTAATVAPVNLASEVTGTLPISSGGTGSTTQNFVDLSTAQTVAGNKTLSGNTSIGGTLNVTGVTTLTAAPILSSTTASQALFTDVNKNVVSNAITGTGNVVMSTSPSLVTPALGTPSALVLTNATGLPLGNVGAVTGALGVANGGTGLATTPANGQIDIGNGTGFTRATLTAGTGVSITNGAGSITIAASAVAVRPTTDQFTGTLNQTSFTLTQTPLTNANSKPNVWMFINGVRTNNNAYAVSGTTVTYTPASNGGYAITASDRIQFDYAY